MSGAHWEALAELFLTTNDHPEEIYCLCSRVFVSSKEEKQLTTAFDEDSGSDCDFTVQSDNAKYSKSNKHEGDTEAFSCYYSASHTDNISTDEHDSIREHSFNKTATLDDLDHANIKGGLHSSDSGADLTEYTKNECDAAFIKYWHDNQEQIIINSWMAQYSAYINPEFIQQNPHLFNSDAQNEDKAGPSNISTLENVNLQFKSQLSNDSDDFNQKSELKNDFGDLGENEKALKDPFTPQKSLESESGGCKRDFSGCFANGMTKDGVNLKENEIKLMENENELNYFEKDGFTASNILENVKSTKVKQDEANFKVIDIKLNQNETNLNKYEATLKQNEKVLNSIEKDGFTLSNILENNKRTKTYFTPNNSLETDENLIYKTAQIDQLNKGMFTPSKKIENELFLNKIKASITPKNSLEHENDTKGIFTQPKITENEYKDVFTPTKTTENEFKDVFTPPKTTEINLRDARCYFKPIKSLDCQDATGENEKSLKDPFTMAKSLDSGRDFDFAFNLSKIQENEVLQDVEYQKKVEVTHRNQMLIRNLSGSESMDKITNEIANEGWNILSPACLDLENETERLLNSRCGSHASSSIRTVDSLTNVTRMTVSSIDFNDSKTSDSISSVSSVQSSLTSSSSEEIEDNLDYDQQWQHLWKKNYEEQYNVEYNKFVTSWYERQHCEDFNVKKEKNKLCKSQKGNLETLQEVSPNLNYINSQFDNLSLTQKNLDSHDEVNSLSESDQSYMENNSELEQMQSMGLPGFFGKQKSNQKTRKVPNSKTIENVKSAFETIGLSLTDKNKFKGNVIYKKKHIRLQNKQLKMGFGKKPTHIRFDEDGNETVENKQEKEEVSDYSEQNCSTSSEDQLLPQKTKEMDSISSTTPRKRTKRKLESPTDVKYNAKLAKYYKKRFSLFSKFDQGIQLDDESWYSVTPEKIAKAQAARCQCDVIIDAFCGVGGNSIQFALTCKKVIAIDIDPQKIEMAKINAKIYKVSDKIEFICGDFFQLAPFLKGDVVFLSPPWGGPNYVKEEVFDLEKMLLPKPYSQLMHFAQKISLDIGLFLPRNSNMDNLIESAKNSKTKMEIVQCFLNNKFIALTVYYNNLVKQQEQNTQDSAP